MHSVLQHLGEITRQQSEECLCQAILRPAAGQPAGLGRLNPQNQEGRLDGLLQQRLL